MKTWIRFKENLSYGFQTMIVILFTLIVALWPMALSVVSYKAWFILIYIPYSPILYAVWKTFIEER